MNREWIVVADYGSARIFARDSKVARPELVMELDHPEGRLRSSELASDTIGQKQRPPADAPAGVAQSTSPHDVENERFTRQLAEQLSQAIKQGECAHLQLVVAPRMLGALRPHLKGLKAGAVEQEHAKDLANLPTSQLPDRLKALLA
jgi:protein required for attachment to host cells